MSAYTKSSLSCRARRTKAVARNLHQPALSPHVSRNGSGSANSVSGDLKVGDVVRGLANKWARSLKVRGFLGTLAHAATWPFYVGLHLIRRQRPAQRRFERREADFDRRFGIDTTGTIDLNSLQIQSDNWFYGRHYSPTPSDAVPRIIGDLPIRHEDFVFVDLGSGKGRVLLLASEFPFKKVIGVEFSPELHAIAEQNIRSYRSESQKCRAVECICQDAT